MLSIRAQLIKSGNITANPASEGFSHMGKTAIKKAKLAARNAAARAVEKANPKPVKAVKAAPAPAKKKK